MKVLIVEDHKNMATAIGQILKKNKYVVDLAFDGESGLSYALSDSYDVIILDVMLPYLDGYTILRKIREENILTPVLMLTAKIETEDKVKGLDLGADDYLAKPFETEELLARLRAITRRKGTIIKKEALTFNNLLLNMDDLLVTCKDKSFILTVKEATLLELFIKKPNTIISKDTIINKLWSFDKVVIDNNVEVYISFLRKKLEVLDKNIKIKTIRGMGYKLVGDNSV